MFRFLIITLLLNLVYAQTWNNPYPATDELQPYYYTSFSEPPKTLDPARAYSSNEWMFIGQIYEPPLQYHYLLRPYTLVPLSAKALPQIRYYASNGEPRLADSPDIAYTTYDVYIKPGIYYQPHPALARNSKGEYVYHHLDENVQFKSLADFRQNGTREVTANDYVYQIKRLADPQLHSPIYSLLSKYIEGLSQLHDTLAHTPTLALRNIPLLGAKVIDRYHYRIRLKGHYAQFIYWLATPFFAPMPWEADVFYQQAVLQAHNISLAWYPIGSGPYMLTENNPNRRMVLSRNPNFKHERYPRIGMPGDKAKGLLDAAGEPLPLIKKVIFSLEKESIPRWNKFLQGYYDRSGIASDNFSQAITIDRHGQPHLTEALAQRDLRLQTSVEAVTMYMGFNMLDPIVGGYTEQARALRQAISIAVDYEEFIQIFNNGRGIAAQGPIPPGIFGYQDGEQGINPIIYTWQQGHARRRNIAQAKALLAKAGYANGIDRKTGHALQLNYDVPGGNSPDAKAIYNWLRKQFAKLGIELHIRATQYNRFQEKMRGGQAQIFLWGWHADYPDPENFLSLLYGPNAKVAHGGENASNYVNTQYDKLYEQMRDLPNGAQRAEVIAQMLAIVRKDAPWIWGYHPKQFQLVHSWNMPSKSHAIANNTLKYINIDPVLRAQKRASWNEPMTGFIYLIVLLLIAVLLPVLWTFWRLEYGDSQ